METAFTVCDILKIAEEVEHKAAKFYLTAADKFVDQDRRSICNNLSSRRAKHKRAWGHIRRDYSERTGEFGTFDPDNYVSSNPAIMAGLTGFGTDVSRPQGSPTGRETGRELIQDAIKRAKSVIIFYRGLKEFARDLTTRTMLDRIIAEEDRQIRLLARSLGHTADHPVAGSGRSVAVLQR